MHTIKAVFQLASFCALVCLVVGQASTGNLNLKNETVVNSTDHGKEVPVPPKPNNESVTNTSVSTVAPPPTTIASSTTTSTTTTTTTAPTTTSTIVPTTKIPATTISTITPTPTILPKPSAAPSPAEKDRSFDGMSFIGGIVLAVGLLAIGVVAFKFYRARDGPASYFTL